MPDKPPSLRARQAQLTREEILKAARTLFAERGYPRTSVRDIAEAAGVSAQTVYDSIGSKQAIVAQLNDLIDAEADIGSLVGATVGSRDPELIVTLSARVTCSILRHCGDIIHALVTGAASEPDLAVALTEGHRRHVQGARMVVGLLQELDALDDGIEVDGAVESLSALSDVQFALLLRDSYGWSLAHVEAWIGATSRTLLLGPT